MEVMGGREAVATVFTDRAFLAPKETLTECSQSEIGNQDLVSAVSKFYLGGVAVWVDRHVAG